MGMKSYIYREVLIDDAGVPAAPGEIAKLHQALEATGYVVKWDFAGNPVYNAEYPPFGEVVEVTDDQVVLVDAKAKYYIDKSDFLQKYKVD